MVKVMTGFCDSLLEREAKAKGMSLEDYVKKNDVEIDQLNFVISVPTWPAWFIPLVPLPHKCYGEACKQIKKDYSDYDYVFIERIESFQPTLRYVMATGVKLGSQTSKK